jgi:hypothetical protein
VAQIICNAGALYKASESVSMDHYLVLCMTSFDQVALLDMLWSFAHVSISKERLFIFYGHNKYFLVVRDYGLSILFELNT